MAFCTQCGKKLREGANFCTVCGAKVRQQTRSTAPSSSYSRPTPTRTQSATPSDMTFSGSSPRTKSPVIFQTKTTRKEESTKNQRISQEEPNELESISNIETSSVSESEGLSKNNKTTRLTESSEVETENIKYSAESGDLFSDEEDLESFSHENSVELSEKNKINEELFTQLKRIKYSFKELEEVEKYLYSCTFIAGSIEKLIWDFRTDFKLIATLPTTINKEIRFSVELKENRLPYNWKKPYDNILFNHSIQNDQIVRKIKREGRVIEKLSRISGAVRAEIDGQKIILEINEKIPNNCKLALDAIKEIAWMMDITLK